MNEDPIDRSEAYHRVSDVLACKWMMAVLDAIGRGVARPSDIQRELPGLSGKVLNDRLKRLEGFGALEREAFAEVPPRVEYRLSARGERLARIVGEVSAFVDDWSGSDRA